MAEVRRIPSPGSTIDGRWTRLVPVAAYTDTAIEDLRFRLGLRPEMVAPGIDGAAAGSSRFGDAAIIAEVGTGRPLGILGNVEIGDYPGVTGLVIYVDQENTRTGYAMEAWFHYVQRMFDLGATKIQMEVMSFNIPVHRIMRKIGARPEVVLRQHFYIAGRHWDGTLYAFDRKDWAAVERRYGDIIPRVAAVGGSRLGPVQSHERAPLIVSEGERVKVDYLILADAAIAADGKHYLHGAGWDTVIASAFPVIHRHVSAALRLRLPNQDSRHRLGVDVVGPDGASLLASPIYTDVAPDPTMPANGAEDQALCLVFNFDGLRLGGPGTHAVVVNVDGVEAHRSPFQVRTIG
ncbi:MAG TPA: GNAT family protein [Candidatus Dormibacteraeota bacterium]|nr:GNAT family protein [Candidatus Dormibacteraeota bacterium]